MFKNLLTSAVFAGVGAGLCAALIQFAFVIPLLLEGELYETGARVHFNTDGSTQSVADAVALGGDWARHGMTVAFNMVTYTGFAFLMLAAMLMAQTRGVALTAKSGLVWGLCGFVAVQLAPAFGMSPELPGTIRTEVGGRQIWWAFTILSTAGGMALIAFGRSSALPVLGIALIALPQIVGAPSLDTYFGVAPPELSGEFAARSLGAAAAGWTLLGGLTAFFYTRFANDPVTAPA